MPLPIDFESDDYRFYKTLNEDVQLVPNQYHKYDLNMVDGDYVNVTGKESLHNAIVITILTRFGELQNNPIYDEFGCRVHELIKANKSEMVLYEIEVFIMEVLENMRRIQEVNWLEITDSENEKYHVEFNVTSINDEIVAGGVEI